MDSEHLSIGNNKEGTYCIIVYAICPIHGAMYVEFVYKDINEYNTKIANDIKKIDSKYGISTRVWIFD